MLEQPECITLARQLSETVQNGHVQETLLPTAHHKFAFYEGDVEGYPALLTGRRFTGAEAVGPYVRMHFEGTTLLLRDGVNLRYLPPGAPLPEKRQLALRFEDGSALVTTVQMYGALQAFPGETLQNPYYEAAKNTPSALSSGFTPAHFEALCAAAKPTLSAKALLATEQRIPGIGNGTLQDILLRAHVHPKRKLNTLCDEERHTLYRSVVETMADMAAKNGRDTEKDLFSAAGGYLTLLSSKTWQYPCPQCGGAVQRMAYLGGNVYVCPACQPL